MAYSYRSPGSGWVKTIKRFDYKVAVRIVKSLSEKAFIVTPNEDISIHTKLFVGIYGHVEKLQDDNITKKEWLLNNSSL